jgi:hypothetical protein
MWMEYAAHVLDECGGAQMEKIKAIPIIDRGDS